mgnify:CR=1 FL=1
MAELTIRPEEIRSALNEFAESYKPAEVAASSTADWSTSGSAGA